MAEVSPKVQVILFVAKPSRDRPRRAETETLGFFLGEEDGFRDDSMVRVAQNKCREGWETHGEFPGKSGCELSWSGGRELAEANRLERLLIILFATDCPSCYIELYTIYF